jgi:hypothetical protein
MYRRLFQITLVLFFVVVTIAMIGLAISAVLSEMSGIMIAGGGSSGFVWSVSQKTLGYMIVAASLVIAGFYLFFRRRRFRR